MNIIELPDLILNQVLKMLDFESKESMWRSCSRFRRLLRSRNLMWRFQLELSNLHSDDFIEELACYSSELVLCHILRINRQLYNTFRLFNRVTLLDLSLTKMYLFDVHELLPALPSLRSLKINFDWLYIKTDDECSDFKVQRCQTNVRRLEHAHFIISSYEILECDHILEVLQHCISLRTLDISVRKIKNRHHLHLHINCTQPIPPSLQVVSFYHDAMSSMRNVHFKCKFINASWKEISLSPGLRHNPKFSISESLQHFFPFVKSCTIYNPAFERLYNPNSDIDHECIFRSISEKLRKQMITEICENRLHSGNLSNHIYKLCPFALPAVHFDVNFIIHLFSLKEVTVPVRDLRVLLMFCHKHINCAEDHKLQVEIESTSVQLHHLSCLEFVNVSVSGDFEVFFRQCENLHTLKLENTTCDRGYTDIVQHLRVLPHLRNFLCADVTIPADQLVEECTFCSKLENIAVWLHGKVPSRKCWSVLICYASPLRYLQIQASDENILTYEELYVKVRHVNISRLNRLIVLDVNEFILGTFIKLKQLEDFVTAMEL